jgi:hypothetical protein
MKSGIKQIGEISIDAGLCWIGDPCYVLHQEQPPEAIGKNWGEFCDLIDHDKGFTAVGDGLGVCVSTGYGDGAYPVYAEFEDGRIMKVWVDFHSGEAG